MSHKIDDWKKSVTGEPFSLLHDHSKLPHTSGHPDDTTLEEQKQILGLTPKLKEMYHRYHIYYHVHHYRGADDLSVGFHIEEAIYARMYYGYGLAGSQYDRDAITEQIETRLKQISEDPIIIVHMTATPDVLARRMAELKDSPEHTYSPVKESDFPTILERFKEGPINHRPQNPCRHKHRISGRNAGRNRGSLTAAPDRFRSGAYRRSRLITLVIPGAARTTLKT
jgi:hypothetical protein